MVRVSGSWSGWSGGKHPHLRNHSIPEYRSGRGSEIKEIEKKLEATVRERGGIAVLRVSSADGRRV